MFLIRKRAFITDWWVAKRSNRMKFVDITDTKNITDDCIIVGYTDAPMPHIGTSRNSVIKITKRGVITASGRFYPFATAHALYLMYLHEIHVPEDAIIASNWACYPDKVNCIIADLEYPDGSNIKDAIFDFETVAPSEIVFAGFSETLKSDVVVNTFDRRQIEGVSPLLNSAYSDIYNTANGLIEDRNELVRDVVKLIKQKRK